MSDDIAPIDFVISDAEYERLSQAIKSAIEAVKPQVEPQPLKLENPACKLPLATIETYMERSREAYMSYQMESMFCYANVLYKEGVDWIDEVPGFFALGLAGNYTNNSPRLIEAIPAAAIGMKKAPLEAPNYIAMALLKISFVQPFQAFKWLDLASLCPNAPQVMLLHLRTSANLLVKSCTWPETAI